MVEISIDDIWDLWRAGAVHMQYMGNQYAYAAQETHQSALSQGQAFNGAAPELVSAFTELRNLVQNDILVASSAAMVNSGTALADIAVRFSIQDDDNKDLLRNKITDLEDNGDAQDRPPPFTPSAPESDDPHPELQSNVPGQPQI
ncbi:hypothetical protein [Stackebrandtia soli]|uniref:hypothetical protein n=1 Tax=Stackebrandtia soli TaxID=1892856 RepID=UPI0039E7C71D